MTEENQPEVNLTLAQELQAAFEAGSKQPDPVVDDPEVEADGATDEPEELSPEDVAEKEFPLIPSEWSDDEKAAFQALLDSDDEDKILAAEILIERHNSMKKGFYNKTRELAEKSKDIDAINEVFAPVEPLMKQAGIDKASYIKTMMMWEQALSQQPVETVKQIMQKYGVSPKQLGAKSSELDFDDDFDYSDKENEEIADLKKQLRTLQNQVANQPLSMELANFKNATDADGELLYPKFEDVRVLMGTLIQTGKARDLKDAYKKATRAIDDESSEPNTGSAVNVEEVRKRIAKSRKAARTVKSTSSRPDFSKMSLAEELTARFNG